MFKNKLLTIFLVCLGLAILSFILISKRPEEQLMRVAIANWGPHSSLEETIRGLKDGLKQSGFQEGVQIQFDQSDVNFDPSLIGQMIAKLKAQHPKVIVALSTPVAQRAKGDVKDIPIVFTDVTDPVSAGLIGEDLKASGNLTGVSEKQDLDAFIDFVQKILPNAQKIGILFATAEANDRALVKMMEAAAAHHSMQVFAVPVDEPRDIPIRMQKFRDNVDLIYVGTSGPIQPSLPAIVNEADRMKIPVFNADADHVKNHQTLGAFAVSYYQVGLNTAKLVKEILNGAKPESLAPIFPSLQDHAGFISKRKARELGMNIPTTLQNTTLVD